MAADDDDDDGGGVADEHPVAPGLSAFVASSTGGEFNTLNPPFLPVACTRVNDIRFDFDSSMVRPRIAREMRKLANLVDTFRGAPVSVFSHADPVGSDDYNKQLSGRRAIAIYALLTRRIDLWEELYSSPLGGDNWGIRSVRVMLGTVEDPTAAPYLAVPASASDGETFHAVTRFQADHQLTVDGSAGPDTRRALFAAYMDAICRRSDGSDFRLAASDFLGKGLDPGGKADFQGCSEFNPVRVFSRSEQAAFDAVSDKTDRNQQNEINRRVLVFLFRPGLTVVNGAWPCPRAREPVAACKQQFWPNGDQRRSPQAARREYKDTKDTMACRFYDSMARRSPCEGIQIVQAVRIRLFDREARPLAKAPFHVTSGQSPERGFSDVHGFVVVRDVTAQTIVSIEWRVSDEDRAKRGWPPVTDPDRFDFAMDVFAAVEQKLDDEQVRRRLSNLGYASAGTLSDNVRQFQRDYDLTVNGNPKDPTMQSVLQQRHDDCEPKKPPRSTENAPLSGEH